MNDHSDLVEFVTVKLLVDLPSENLTKGATGVIVLVYPEGKAFEVEFCDVQGIPVSKSATLTLPPRQIERFKK